MPPKFGVLASWISGRIDAFFAACAYFAAQAAKKGDVFGPITPVTFTTFRYPGYSRGIPPGFGAGRFDCKAIAAPFEKERLDKTSTQIYFASMKEIAHANAAPHFYHAP